jgi:hypothetical protein
MNKRQPEKLTVNLTTCRASPSEAKAFMEVLHRLGFEKQSHFWRRVMKMAIEQNSHGREIELPVRFLEKKRKR